MKNYFLISIVIAVLMTTAQSCVSTQINKDDKLYELTVSIATFWLHVSKNEKEIISVDYNDREMFYKILTELNQKIQLVNKNLYIFLDRDPIDNKRDLIISSGGNSDYFALCDLIVKAAPALVHLNPVSLLPPTDEIDLYAIGNLVFYPEEILVHVDGDDRVELLFLLSSNHLSKIRSDASGEAYSAYMQALYQMTMQLLGERIFATKISTAAIAPLPLIMPSVPFRELRNYIH